jgi:anaerobic magnesium-protoporphyrin IX monomethyl ester cyclase
MAVDALFVNLPPYESYYSVGVPHLGLLYVATSLRHHGYNVGFLDCARRPLRRSEIIKSIREVEPRIVGFSIDTDNLHTAGNLTRELKRELPPDTVIVLGGPASQGQPEEIMERSAADVLVIGEGEYAIREVADCFLRSDGRLQDIPGICYRGPDGLVMTLPRPPIADLDAVPIPDRNFLPRDHRYEASIISGRGCPFRCTFCFEGRMGNKYRHRSVENILAEIEYLIQTYGRPFISINDDTFTSDPDHTLELCRRLRERFEPWKDYLLFCEVRVDVVHQRLELVDALVEAGVARIQVGVESADLDVLRAYKRLNVKPAVVEDVVGRFHRAGLPSTYCGFIMGGPNETAETMQRTLDFARRMLLEVAPGSFECSASFLTPLPGTDIRRHPEGYGVKLLDPELVTSSNFNFCVAETEALGMAEINNFRLHFVHEIDRLIRQLVSKLPRKLVETHARLYHDFGVVTQYYERFSSFPRLTEYFDLVGDGKYDAASRLNDDEILARFPTRLTSPVQMDGDCIIVTNGPATLRLNPFGSRIFALCGGKLTGGDILDRVLRDLDADKPLSERVRGDVLAFLRNLDENYAIFLKDY